MMARTRSEPTLDELAEAAARERPSLTVDQLRRYRKHMARTEEGRREWNWQLFLTMDEAVNRAAATSQLEPRELDAIRQGVARRAGGGFIPEPDRPDPMLALEGKDALLMLELTQRRRH